MEIFLFVKASEWLITLRTFLRSSTLTTHASHRMRVLA